MKQILPIVLFAVFASGAFAQDKDAQKSRPLTAQQQRMKDCNAQAGDKKLKGDERKSFMSSCLRGQTAEASKPRTAQQEKMVSCNKQAGDKKLKGAERKAFMSDCLKG